MYNRATAEQLRSVIVLNEGKRKKKEFTKRKLKIPKGSDEAKKARMLQEQMKQENFSEKRTPLNLTAKVFDFFVSLQSL